MQGIHQAPIFKFKPRTRSSGLDWARAGGWKGLTYLSSTAPHHLTMWPGLRALVWATYNHNTTPTPKSLLWMAVAIAMECWQPTCGAMTVSEGKGDRSTAKSHLAHGSLHTRKASHWTPITSERISNSTIRPVNSPSTWPGQSPHPRTHLGAKPPQTEGLGGTSSSWLPGRLMFIRDSVLRSLCCKRLV